MPQPQPRQQSRFNDIQMLQRHIMFNQLQELQRQQQFSELGDARQQNYINQQVMINKQASGAQFPPVINGTPIHDASQMFMVGNMNLVPCGASPVVQGFSNGLVFPQAQSQALRSMGLVSQQLDVSLYGTPIASAGNHLSQYSHLQGASHDSTNVLTKGKNNQAEKPIIQSSAFSNPFMSDQCDVSSNHVYMPDGTFVSKQAFQDKNLFGQVPTQGLNSGILPGNFHELTTLQRNALVQEFGGRQEQAGSPRFFLGKSTSIGLSQGVASLDPLEQKILFNMDDNNWAASFGRHSKTGTGGFESSLEHTDHLSALPSVQSGSWSALMQSAVAEASSSDTGLQEEWSGLSFQNPELSTDNLPSNFVDGGKQQTNWVENNLQSASSLSSKPELLFNNSYTNCSFPGFQQSGIQFSLEQKERMPSDSSHEFIQRSPKNSGKWLDCYPQQKQPIEGSQSVQKLSPLQSAWPSQHYEDSVSDAHQQNILSYTNGTQPGNNQRGNINEAAYKDPDSLWKTDNNHVGGSFSNSIGGLEQGKSGIVNRENSQLNHFIALPTLSTTRVDQTADQETIRHVLESHQHDYIKHADISIKDGAYENMGNDQHQQLSSSPQILLHSYKGASETYEKRENCYQKENSNDSYHSNASHHTITGHELRENAWICESESQPVAEGNQQRSGQVLCQKVPQGLSSQEQGYGGQFKFIGNDCNSGMDLEKGCLPDIQINFKGSEEVHSRSNLGSNISDFFDRSAGFHGPNTTAQTSQNMLELLHKVDKSMEHRPGMHFGSTDSTPLFEVPQAETSDASFAQLYNESSPSQCFGLRLAPPFQGLPNSNCFDSSKSSPQTGNSTATYVRNQLQNQHQPAAPVACQSLQATLPGLGSRYLGFNPATSQDTSRLICTSPSGQQFPDLEPKVLTPPSVRSGISQQVRFPKKPPSVWTNVPTQRNLPGTEPHKVPLSLLPSPDSMNSSLETASGPPQEPHDQHYFKEGNNLREIGAGSINSQSFDCGGEQPGKERSGHQISSEILGPVSQKGKLSHGQESVAKHLSEANLVASGLLMTGSHQQGLDRSWHSDNQTPEISARDLEAFGHSLKPSHAPPQNYSLLHQMHSVKNAETDPSKGVSEKNDRVNSDGNFQQGTAIAEQQLLYGHNSGVRNLVNSELNVVSQLNPFPSGENKILRISSEARGYQPVKASSLPLHRDAFQERVTFGQNDSQSHSISTNVALDGTERPPINLQMAPSWFKHYGTLRNGQMLPMYDAKAAKNSAQQFSLGKPFENLHTNSSLVQRNSTGASQVSSVWPTTATTLVAVKRLSPPYVFPPNITDQNLAVLRPKKRKIAILELLPWHKEVTEGSQRLQNSSMAELEWAQAANQLIEKVEDEAEMIEDALPMLRPKKRLTLTTQLMQQVFRPAPAVILSEDATSNYCTVAYFAARLALGDACSLTSNSHMPCDFSDMSSEKPKTSQRIDDQDFSKIMEDFVDRSKRLEGELLRLDKKASLLDTRVESQELERFSVINRFAKFHSRGQAGAAETSASTGTTLNVLKTFPQRYVTALPMPRTVPEGAQCLSL